MRSFEVTKTETTKTEPQKPRAINSLINSPYPTKRYKSGKIVMSSVKPGVCVHSAWVISVNCQETAGTYAPYQSGVYPMVAWLYPVNPVCWSLREVMEAPSLCLNVNLVNKPGSITLKLILVIQSGSDLINSSFFQILNYFQSFNLESPAFEAWTSCSLA